MWGVILQNSARLRRAELRTKVTSLCEENHTKIYRVKWGNRIYFSNEEKRV